MRPRREPDRAGHARRAVVRTRRAAVLAAGLLLGPILAPAGAADTPELTPDPFGYFTPVLVVLDTSGSMDDVVDGSDTRRIDAAQGAVLDLVTALGTGQQFGLMRYPDPRAATDAEGCEQASSTVRLGPLDVSAAAAAVRTLEPDGGTPTGPAIAQAAELLRTTYGGRAGGVVVVVSDGESNCGTPPCDVARQVRDSGLEVQFNTIGLNLSDDQSEQLRCVAEVGEGTYVDVADGGDPSDAIARASRAALALDVQVPQSFDVVAGTGDGGTQVQVEVSSTGRTRAANVRVSLVVTRSGTGNVTVAHPVRFLGNLAPGEAREVSFTVRPDDDGGDGPVEVSVSALAGNAAPVVWTGASELTDTLDAGRLGGVLAGVERVAVLGDSYSSGEGTGSYRSEASGNACHRSDAAYGPQLWGVDTVVIACSGAVTGELTGFQRSGGVDVPPQLGALRSLVLEGEAPDAVVLSIGGNDAGFGTVAQECIVGAGDCLREMAFLAGRPDMLDPPSSLMLVRGMDIQDDVRDALAKVDATVNDAEALAAREGGPIPVVLVPYPRIVPVTSGSGEPPEGCALWISGDELTMLNSFVDAINTSVTLAGLSLRSAGRPVYVATPIEEAFQPDHTLCEGTQAYANTWAAAGEAKVESLHPTAAGHAAMARALVAWSGTGSARPVTVRGTPTFQDAWIARPAPWYSPILAPLRTLAVAGPGEQVRVSATGLAPGTTAVVRLASSPQALTSLVADDTGRVQGWTTVPAGAAPGSHHLQVVGHDPDGEPVLEQTPLRVLPAGGRSLLVTLVGGLALLASAGAVLARSTRAARR